MTRTLLFSALLALGTAAAVAQPAPCNPSSTTLCLSSGRFEVKVTWTDFQSNTGDGQAVSLTPDTGYFWFFTDTNVELVVKVLDARGVNGHFWVFYGALSNVQYELTVRDSQTGDYQIYDNPAGQFASTGDTSAFPPSAATVLSTESRALAPAGRLVDESRVAPSVPNSAAACVPDPTTLCLNAGRFRLQAAWTDFQGNTGVGQAVGLTTDTGYFWFFSNTNVEAVVKVLDARALNNYFWVFYGALSNVAYTLTVTDTVTGIVKVYSNPSGLFASVGDTSAFGTPTTFQLIDGGVVKGEIDAETALLYKVYAFFGDPRLPQAYVGDPPGPQDHRVMMDAAAGWSSLSAQTQQLLQPFFTPPIYAGSWFAGGSASTTLSPERTLSDWTKIPTARSWVWYRAADANAQTAANNLAASIEFIWTAETGLMGREPLQDTAYANNGGDEKLDIYVLPSFRGSPNAVGLTNYYPPFDHPTATYILIKAEYASTIEGARDVLAHEFFHTIAATYFYKDGLDAYEWMDEATAQWMEDFVYPTQINNLEQDYAPVYFESGYKESLDKSSHNGYDDYLFFFYLARQYSPIINAQIWDNVAGMSAVQAIQAAIPGGFAGRWPEFALDCWNQPDVDDFKQWDKLSAGLDPANAVPSLALTAGNGSSSLPPRSVAPRAMSYAYIKVSNDDIKWLEIQNQRPAASSSSAKVQAWIKLADGTTRTEPWTDKDHVVFCRDQADQRVSEILILYTNGNADDAGAPVVWNAGNVMYDSIGCGYHGTMHMTVHEPDGSDDETIDVTANLQHVSQADFGTSVYYAAAEYTVRYHAILQVNGCTDTIAPTEQTFVGANVAASLIIFDTSTDPATYSAQAPFFMQVTETEVCPPPEGSSQKTTAAAGLWWDVPGGQFQVKPDGSLSGTYTDGVRTFTWNFQPDVGDDGS